MAKILMIDDEPLSLRRLFKILCDDRQHNLWTAASLDAGMEVVEKLGKWSRSAGHRRFDVRHGGGCLSKPVRKSLRKRGNAGSYSSAEAFPR
jgi:hypothetical protein